MEVHQTEFLQAVVLAGAVALVTTAWEDGREEARAQAPVEQSHIAAATPRIEVRP